MEADAQIAARNNADLCGAIMVAHGLRVYRDDHVFVCRDDPPPFYPKLITLSPHGDVDLDGVNSVKDSFSCLDTFEFKIAFDASWIWAQARGDAMPVDWCRIDNASDLHDWHAVWRGDAADDRVIFPPACMNDPSLVFLARRVGGVIHAGCLANISDDVIGLSNVFSTTPIDAHLYEQALSALSHFGGGRAVVGYEHGDDLNAACDAGFHAVGPLRVLIRKR
jgi:hypothetical protein